MSAKGHKKTAGSGTDGNEKERISNMTTLTQKDASLNWVLVLEHLKEQPGAGYYDGTPEEVRACRSFRELGRHSFNLVEYVEACYEIGVPYDEALRYANADICTAAFSRQQKEERDND